MKKKFKKGVISLMIGLMVLYGVSLPMLQFVDAADAQPGQTAAIYLDGNKGNDANDGASEATAVKTFAKAKALAGANGNIKVKAFAEKTGIVIDNGLNVQLISDITMDGGGATSGSGIIVRNGGVLTAPGKTLTMKNYNSKNINNEGELVVDKGGTIGDGNYQLKSGDNGQAFLAIGGTVEGTSRDSLKIYSDAGYAPNFIHGTAASYPVFNNCTVTIISRSTSRISWKLFGAWVDTALGNLYLNNADMTVKGIGGGFYLTPHFKDSVLTIDDAGREIVTAATWSGKGSIENSTVNVDTGSTAGISVSPNCGGNITGSTVNFNNGGTGGLNCTGDIHISDSNIIGGAKAPNALMGTGISSGSSGTIIIDGNSYVATPNNPGGAIGSGANRIQVDSGLFNVNPAKVFNSNGNPIQGDPITVNAAKTTLTLFELTAHPAGNVMDLGSYQYKVPAVDGAQYTCVWVPAKTVTFNLNNETVGNSATFSDGTTADKTETGMLNQPLKLVKSANNVTQSWPVAPSAPGYKFLGWYTEDGKVFTADTPVTDNMTVKAKWGTDAASYAVQYHKNLQGDNVIYTKSGNSPDRKEQVASYDDVTKALPAFLNENLQFVSWNTKADGSGKTYIAGESINIPEDQGSVALYAQYREIPVELRFETRGGSFTDKSNIFTNDKVFTLEDDGQCGQVAVLKTVKGKTLLEAIQEKDPSITSLPAGFAPSTSFNTLFTPPEYFHMPVSYSETFFIWTTDYYSWYLNGSPAKTLSGSTKLEKSETYYLNWEIDSNVVPEKYDNLPLDGDLLVGENTEHDDYYPAVQGSYVTYTGRLDVKSIKDQLLAIEGSTGGGNAADIAISHLDSGFTLKLKVGDGLQVDTDKLSAVLDDNPIYQVEQGSVTYDETAKVISVPMTLKSQFASFDQLKAAVIAAGGNESKIDVNISGIKVTAATGTQTLVGDVTGYFKALAVKSDGGASLRAAGKAGKAVYFDLTWKAVQQKNPNGQDFLLRDTPDSKEISFTSQVPETVTDKDLTVPGDILVYGNTEHDAYYDVKTGEDITYTGRLYVENVKNQIESIKNAYGKDTSNISLSDVDTAFTAKLVLGKGLKVDTDKLSAKLTENELFKAGKVTYDKATNTITVPMEVKSEFKTFDDLYKAVMKAGGDDSILDVDVAGVNVTAEEGLQTVTGTVNGYFKATAKNNLSGKIINYDFQWNADQILENPNGQDFLLRDKPESKEISFTSQVTGTTAASMTVPGDILVKGNTEHDAYYDVKTGDAITYTGRLYVENIKDQIESLKDDYGKDTSKIALSDVDTAFTAKLVLGTGLKVDTDKLSAKLTDNDLFKMGKVTYDKATNTITVPMELKSQFKTFDELYKAVMNAGGKDSILDVDVTGVSITAEEGLQTVKGTVDGYFKATAKNTESGIIRNYDFAWNADQILDNPNGQDFLLRDTPKSTEISFTTQVPGNTEASMTVPGDILVNGNTEHDAYYEVKTGDDITYTGRLYVENIKNQIESLKDAYGKDTSKIALSDVDTAFEAKLVLGEGLKVDTDKLSATLSDNDLFKIGKVTYDEETNTITVPMELKSEFKTFDDLYKAVMNAGGKDSILDIDVTGVSVTAKEGLQTVKGTVTGHFKATAKNNESGIIRNYDFTWNADQILDNPNGQDFLLRDTPESTEISFTSEVKKIEPEKPVNPDKPQTPDQKDNSETKNVNTGDRGFGEYAILLIAAAGLTAAMLKRKRIK